MGVGPGVLPFLVGCLHCSEQSHTHAHTWTPKLESVDFLWEDRKIRRDLVCKERSTPPVWGWEWEGNDGIRRTGDSYYGR